MEASKYATEELSGAPKDVPLPENSLDALAICACTSKPTTLFHFLKFRVLE